MANTVYKGEYGKPASGKRKNAYKQSVALKASNNRKRKKK